MCIKNESKVCVRPLQNGRRIFVRATPVGFTVRCVDPCVIYSDIIISICIFGYDFFPDSKSRRCPRCLPRTVWEGWIGNVEVVVICKGFKCRCLIRPYQGLKHNVTAGRCQLLKVLTQNIEVGYKHQRPLFVIRQQSRHSRRYCGSRDLISSRTS